LTLPLGAWPAPVFTCTFLGPPGLRTRELKCGDTVTVYRNGDWSDLCLGPHVPSTGGLKAFKLMKLAGAYWRGDENRPMLTRIYGTDWATPKDLRAYLQLLVEAEKAADQEKAEGEVSAVPAMTDDTIRSTDSA